MENSINEAVLCAVKSESKRKNGIGTFLFCKIKSHHLLHIGEHKGNFAMNAGKWISADTQFTHKNIDSGSDNERHTRLRLFPVFIVLTPQLCNSTNKEHMCDTDEMRFSFSLI